jgi:ribosome-binding factor A
MSKAKRQRQVADVIRHQVAFLLKKEVSDPRLRDVTLTYVDVSSDLSNAKIYFSLPHRDQLKDVNKSFEKATGFLRRELANKVDLRYVPKISFVYDESIDRGSRMTDLIDEALNQDEQRKNQDEKP